jgi:hypothetical protein
MSSPDKKEGRDSSLSKKVKGRKADGAGSPDRFSGTGNESPNVTGNLKFKSKKKKNKGEEP